VKLTSAQLAKLNKKEPPKKKSSYIKKKRICAICNVVIEGAVIYIFQDDNPYGICCVKKAFNLLKHQQG